MEYLHIILQRLQDIPNFNFHSKCDNISIINLSFANDLLLFFRGDPTSVDLLMHKFEVFSKSTGLSINPEKCKILFGNIVDSDRVSIQGIIKFAEGQFPFKYLGIPLSSKKLNISHYLPLIDRILERINHWSSRLLSMVGRRQLINNVILALSNFWLQCLPLPKKVIVKIESACKFFLWSGSDKITIKSLIAWKKLCIPKKHGGLNIIDLSKWNKACLAKLL
ncbi:unnamed protein product [Lathyrus sativus]|nr:unnamed protein product [Lathyrus sativus]